MLDPTIPKGDQMPYIITAGPDEAEAEWRRAVGTLDEAWHALPPGIADTALARERLALEKRGRAVFPRPNGATVTIERVTYDELAGRVFDRDDYAPRFETDIIDQFNMR